MTRDEAVKWARKMLDWHAKRPSHYEDNDYSIRLATALRDLLALEVEPSEAVKRCRDAARTWRGSYNGNDIVTMADAIDALPDTLAPVLTEADRFGVEWLRTWITTSNDQGMPTVGAAVVRTLAIIDRLCPPEPKHPDIPIGSKPVYGLDGNVIGYVL